MSYITTQGYVGASRGGRQVLVHREIMAAHLGRALAPGELVHHDNEIKTDNCVENLVLSTRVTHPGLHRKPGNRVRLLPSGRWYAWQNMNGKQRTIGTFDSEDQARHATA